MIIVRHIRILESMEHSPDWEGYKLFKYVINDSKVFIECCGIKEEYMWEYYGNKQLLVYTPLTEKCFLTFF